MVKIENRLMTVFEHYYVIDTDDECEWRKLWWNEVRWREKKHFSWDEHFGGIYFVKRAEYVSLKWKYYVSTTLKN